jgi:hypothetical protein
MSAPSHPAAEPTPTPDQEANELLLGGLGVLAIGAIGAIAGGAACPLCVVATPALLGAGAYKKWKARKALAGVADVQARLDRFLRAMEAGASGGGQG